MLLNDAVKRVKDRAHRGDVDITTDVITAQIIRAMSDTFKELTRRIPRKKLWKQATLSIVQGTATYSLASDVQEPIIFHYTVNNSLNLPVKSDSDREWFQDIFTPNADQRDPTWYREIGPDGSDNKQIEFYPTPKQALTVNYEYYRNPEIEFTTSDLSNQIPAIPEQLHDALWKGALHKFLKGFDDQNGEDRAKLDYADALSDYDSEEDNDFDTELSLRFGGAPSLKEPNFFNPHGGTHHHHSP